MIAAPMHPHDLLDPALARFVGAHALALFAIAVGFVAVGSALLWRLVHRVAVPRSDSRLPPLVFLVSRLVLGFGFVAIAGYAFAEVAEALDAGNSLRTFDQALTDSIRKGTSIDVLRVFAMLTRLGDPGTLIVVGLVVGLLLALRGRRWLALGWMLALGGNAVLNPLLKARFARMRPLHDHELVTAAGFSFPSGHSSGSVVVYGMLAYVLLRILPPRWHLIVVVGAAVLAFTVGCSRVFLQVHYASDVAAGFASGFAWLAVCVSSIELLRHYHRVRGAAVRRLKQ
jgi:undecaprenyl-diphosphatase